MVEHTAIEPTEDIAEIDTTNTPTLPPIEQLPDWEVPKP